MKFAWLLVSALGVGSVMADDSIDLRACFQANREHREAELIITAAEGKASKLRRALEDAQLQCVAQLQIDGACLVPVEPRDGQTAESIAKALELNLFALKGGSAPKETQDTVEKVIVNLAFEPVAPRSAKARKVHRKESSSVATDPRFAEQVEFAAIDVETAWTHARGSHVLTAIIDAGVRVDHQDLAGQFRPGVTVDCHIRVCDGTPDYASIWKHHGTLVAGILAPVRGNPYGGIGLAWNTEFMSISYGRVFSEFTASCALQYAIGKQVDIVNASWDGAVEKARAKYLSWDYFKKYVKLAEERGILLVIAAGNDGVNLDDTPRYPMSLVSPNMLVVMAYNLDDRELPESSNYGKTVTHIAAPDFASLTTCIASVRCYDFTGDFGTSWSAAYASGTAALLKARNPGVDHEFLKWRITANATPDDRLTQRTESGGRLNVVGAIFPVTVQGGALSRTRDIGIDWNTGIRRSMCASVSILGRPIRGDTPGEYFPIVERTPNDGNEVIPHETVAGIQEGKVQLRVQCLAAAPGAESLPLPLH